MFPEEWYPISGTIILKKGNDNYICPCIIKYYPFLGNYENSELELSIYNVIKVTGKQQNKETQYANIDLDDIPLTFNYNFTAQIEKNDYFVDGIEISKGKGIISTHPKSSESGTTYFYPYKSNNQKYACELYIL